MSSGLNGLHKKADKMLAEASAALARAVRSFVCKGLPLEEVLQHVEAAAGEDGLELLEQLLDPDESRDYELGGFWQWLGGLQAGWGSLPEKLPRQVLARFLEQAPANRPTQRCAACWLALPASYKVCWERCPACGSPDLEWRDLSVEDDWWWPRWKNSTGEPSPPP
jgi:hypothetical protein